MELGVVICFGRDLVYLVVVVVGSDNEGEENTITHSESVTNDDISALLCVCGAVAARVTKRELEEIKDGGDGQSCHEVDEEEETQIQRCCRRLHPRKILMTLCSLATFFSLCSRCILSSFPQKYLASNTLANTIYHT